MEPARLNDRALLALTGPEAGDFLQGLVTNDVKALAPGKAVYAALLAPQGKILFDFLISGNKEAILLDCPAPAREALARKLRMYRLRARIAIEDRDDLVVFAGLAAPPPGAVATYDDPRHPGLPRRAIAPPEAVASGLAGPDAYHALRRALGIPEGADFGSDKVFAMDGGLDELHGVSFTKGCYVGQELTARMKHRATSRKRILTARAATGPLPAPGTPLTAGARPIGEMLTADGPDGFALVRQDWLAEAMAQNSPVMAGQIAVALRRPAWLDPA